MSSSNRIPDSDLPASALVLEIYHPYITRDVGPTERETLGRV